MFFKLRNGIKTFPNVLTPDEIDIIIRESIPLLEKISPGHPGLQTNPEFHIHMMKNGRYDIIDKIHKSVGVGGWIYKCWVNYTDPTMRYSTWHTHMRPENPPLRCTSVVYLKGEERCGTLFRKNNKIYKTKGKIGSVVTIPSHLEHSVPEDITEPRFSMAIDFAV